MFETVTNLRQSSTAAVQPRRLDLSVFHVLVADRHALAVRVAPAPNPRRAANLKPHFTEVWKGHEVPQQ